MDPTIQRSLRKLEREVEHMKLEFKIFKKTIKKRGFFDQLVDMFTLIVFAAYLTWSLNNPSWYENVPTSGLQHEIVR